MPISPSDIRQAIGAIADVPGLRMDPVALAEDVVLLAHAFDTDKEFQAACVSTCHALLLLVEDKVDASDLEYPLEDWRSYHYQHRVGQGLPADCRVIYRRVEDAADGAPQIEVKGFGHRRIPEDLYTRMAEERDRAD